MEDKNIRQSFQQQFSHTPTLIIRSPGRINLIGEHTDYNMGLVLPAAIDMAIEFAFSKREDNQCHLYALDMASFWVLDLNKVEKSWTHSWANYIMGVILELRKHNLWVGGFNLVFGGTLPSGAGVSSSAALENGVGFGLNELFDFELSRKDLIQISQNAENQFVGMNCGVMDMFASMMGRQNQVIRLDCKDWTYAYFPFDSSDYCFVLCNSMVKHQLVDSEYNTRRKECEHGVEILRQFDSAIESLRDVTVDFLEQHKASLGKHLYKRCKYVIDEINRVEEVCKALQMNDLERVGALMCATHEGLKNEYEVSCTELDFLVERAKTFPEAVLGARMMGGGFGGCTLNLVKTSFSNVFIQSIKTAYESAFSRTMECYVVRLSDGTAIVQVTE
jgi:galactokinase